MSRVKSIEEQILESMGHKNVGAAHVKEEAVSLPSKLERKRITEEGQILRVSGEEGSPEAKEFISKIETMYKKQFPKGMFNAGVRKSIGSPYISIELGIIPREKQAHNIAMNDDGYHAFMMSLMNDGSIPEKLSIDANQGGSLKVKPEKGSHYAMGSVKFGWKKKSGTLDQVLKHMDLYFKKMRSVVDANLENIYGGSEFIESLREDSDDAYRAKVDGLRKRVSELHTSVKNLTDKIQAMVAKNKGMKHDDPKWDAAREKMNAMEGKRSDQRAKIEELGAKIDKEIEKHKKAKKESVKESDLPTDVIAKIKANNDKMTDLKKNGGSQEEIDALEKENDELNGGNKTSEAQDKSGQTVTGKVIKSDNIHISIKGDDGEKYHGRSANSDNAKAGDKVKFKVITPNNAVADIMKLSAKDKMDLDRYGKIAGWNENVNEGIRSQLATGAYHKKLGQLISDLAKPNGMEGADKLIKFVSKGATELYEYAHSKFKEWQEHSPDNDMAVSFAKLMTQAEQIKNQSKFFKSNFGMPELLLWARSYQQLVKDYNEKKESVKKNIKTEAYGSTGSVTLLGDYDGVITKEDGDFIYIRHESKIDKNVVVGSEVKFDIALIIKGEKGLTYADNIKLIK